MSRTKALELGRRAHEQYGHLASAKGISVIRAVRASQASSAAEKAEAILFGLIHYEPDSAELLIAYAELAALRVRLMADVNSSLISATVIGEARAALWATDRADPSHGRADAVATALTEPVVPETSFIWTGDGVGLLPPMSLVRATAVARMTLAHQLAKQNPRRPEPDAVMTPAYLNRVLRARDRPYRDDQRLVREYRTSVIAIDYAGFDEAALLVDEAITSARRSRPPTRSTTSTATSGSGTCTPRS